MVAARGRTIAFDTGNAIYEAVPDGSGVRRMTPTKLELDEIVVRVQLFPKTT